MPYLLDTTVVIPYLARDGRALVREVVLGSNQSRKDLQPSGPDHQVVEPPAVPSTPELGDADPAALRPVQRRQLLEPFPEDDQQAFRKVAREVWEKSAKEIGQKAQENRQAVLSATGN